MNILYLQDLYQTKIQNWEIIYKYRIMLSRITEILSSFRIFKYFMDIFENFVFIYR